LAAVRILLSAVAFLSLSMVLRVSLLMASMRQALVRVDRPCA